jgi:hypothetical protein
MIPSPHAVRTPSVRGFSGGYFSEALAMPGRAPSVLGLSEGAVQEGRSPSCISKRASGLHLYREAIAILPSPEGPLAPPPFCVIFSP